MKIEKNSKKRFTALIWPFRASLFSALFRNKTSHMKLQSLKMFKRTKDMFYKQFDFFANWQGRLWGFVNLVLWTVVLPTSYASKRCGMHFKQCRPKSEAVLYVSALFAQTCLGHVMRKPVYAICEQQRCSSACAFAQCAVWSAPLLSAA